MTDSHAGGAGGQQSGGAGSHETPQNQTPHDGSPEDQKSPVSWRDHKRALDDLVRFKDQSKAQSTQISELQSQLEALNSKIATQNKDFESLYAQEKQKREAIEAEKKTLLGNVVQSERYRAVYPAMKKAGLRDDAENLIEHMDLSAVKIEATSSGRFVCSGVEPFIEEVKRKYPYAFQKPQAPTVNGGSGSGMVTGERWTPAKLVALESECKKKGDLAPYKRAVSEWVQQGKPTS